MPLLLLQLLLPLHQVLQSPMIAHKQATCMASSATLGQEHQAYSFVAWTLLIHGPLCKRLICGYKLQSVCLLSSSHSLTRCPIFSRARTRSPLGWSQHPFTYLVWSAETGIVCSRFLAAMPSSFQQWLVLLIQNKPEKRRGGGGSSVQSASFWSSCFPPCLLPFPHLSWTLSSIVSGKALEI